MINDNDLYWFAGIIDGEGFLTTNKRQGIHKTRNNGKGQFSFITRIGIGSTDMGLIKRSSEILHELGAKFWYCLHSPHKKFPNAKSYVSINVEGYKSTRKVLVAIIGKLNSHQKTKQAELMLEYVDYRLSMIQSRDCNGRTNSKITEKQFEDYDKKIVAEISSLKNYQISPSTTKRKASTPLEW